MGESGLGELWRRQCFFHLHTYAYCIKPRAYHLVLHQMTLQNITDVSFIFNSSVSDQENNRNVLLAIGKHLHGLIKVKVLSWICQTNAGTIKFYHFSSTINNELKILETVSCEKEYIASICHGLAGNPAN